MSERTGRRCGPLLSRLDWPYQTAPCQALGLDFAVRVMDPFLGAYLDRILVHRTFPGPSAHLYSLVDRGPQIRLRYALFLDDNLIETLCGPGIALAYLLWHINRSVIEHTPDLLLLHAAAVECGGMTLLLPAPTESGKTTLAAGLVQAGLRYVTDEAVAIDPDTKRVVPYPKALSVDPGSWSVLAALRPHVTEEVRPYLDRQWHVIPDAIRPGAVAAASVPGFVIAPRYQAGAETALVPIGRAEAVAILAENAFNLDLHGRLGLNLLADVVRRCRCYRLTIADLDDACESIFDLLGHGKEGRAAS